MRSPAKRLASVTTRLDDLFPDTSWDRYRIGQMAAVTEAEAVARAIALEDDDFSDARMIACELSTFVDTPCLTVDAADVGHGRQAVTIPVLAFLDKGSRADAAGGLTLPEAIVAIEGMAGWAADAVTGRTHGMTVSLIETPFGEARVAVATMEGAREGRWHVICEGIQEMTLGCRVPRAHGGKA